MISDLLFIFFLIASLCDRNIEKKTHLHLVFSKSKSHFVEGHCSFWKLIFFSSYKYSFVIMDLYLIEFNIYPNSAKSKSIPMLFWAEEQNVLNFFFLANLLKFGGSLLPKNYPPLQPFPSYVGVYVHVEHLICTV